MAALESTKRGHGHTQKKSSIEEKTQAKERNLGSKSLACEFPVCTWMAKNVTVSIIYVFKQWMQAQIQTQTHSCYVRSDWHACTKRPTIKMTMWLFECELMYSLTVFTSRHPTIRTYFTQIINEQDHTVATKKMCSVLWLLLSSFSRSLSPAQILMKDNIKSMVSVQKSKFFSGFLSHTSSFKESTKTQDKHQYVKMFVPVSLLKVSEFHLPYDFRDFLPIKMNEKNEFFSIFRITFGFSFALFDTRGFSQKCKLFAFQIVTSQVYLII